MKRGEEMSEKTWQMLIIIVLLVYCLCPNRERIRDLVWRKSPQKWFENFSFIIANKNFFFGIYTWFVPPFHWFRALNGQRKRHRWKRNSQIHKQWKVRVSTKRQTSRDTRGWERASRLGRGQRSRVRDKLSLFFNLQQGSFCIFSALLSKFSFKNVDYKQQMPSVLPMWFSKEYTKMRPISLKIQNKYSSSKVK